MNSSKYNIEVAHIYADQQQIGAEQREGLLYLNFLQKKDLFSLEDAAVTVWIDDYNPAKKILQLDQFVESVLSLCRVDFFASEKKVSEYVGKNLDLLEKSQRLYFTNFYEKKGKYPCSLVTCIWYLLRLGFINVENDFFLREYSEKNFAASQVINILPRKYEPVENKTREIFAANNKISNFLSCIHTYYF